jgi:hypothetical protein
VTERWGQLEAVAKKRRLSLSTIDAQLAATALHHGAPPRLHLRHPEHGRHRSDRRSGVRSVERLTTGRGPHPGYGLPTSSAAPTTLMTPQPHHETGGIDGPMARSRGKVSEARFASSIAPALACVSALVLLARHFQAQHHDRLPALAVLWTWLAECRTCGDLTSQDRCRGGSEQSTRSGLFPAVPGGCSTVAAVPPEP